MAENPSGPADPFDVKRIHHLVRLMKHYDLTALDLAAGPLQVRLRRRGPEAAPPPAPHTPALAAAAHQPMPAPRADSPPPAAPAVAKTVLIESPMVGTYYASSTPDSPPFVNNGSAVHPETIIGIIEAMKVFTEIPAGVSGTIVEVLAKNGLPVEFGQPLFRVVPS
jgi:acetyl-CoA carboxylase biotin carboxyl carrier protein